MQTRLLLTVVATSAAALLFVACSDRPPTVDEICQHSPELCTDLNQDGWCYTERRILIKSRYNFQQQASPRHHFLLLRDLKDYSQCMELASIVEHRNEKQKQSQRIEAYLNSLERLQQLGDQAMQSDAPILLYWRWANRGDTKALQQFLQLRDTPAVQDHVLQHAFASYYAKTNEQQMLEHLYRSLRLYQPDERFIVEVPESLLTYYLQHDDVAAAYIWSRVAIEFGSETITEDDMHAIINADKATYEGWQDVADSVIEALNSDAFKGRPDAPWQLN
ncbi:DUF2989 domain-containing protein [Idiomarina seosinensis]|uniref:DUF2989 domain-containing protein n=1 Tax=Idiomarina seosinensis TaxID=281739 RepID=UPI00384C6689